MKKTVKVIALLLTVIMVMGLFASCGIFESGKKARGIDEVINEVARIIIIKVSANPYIFNHPRILFYAARLTLKGYDVDIANSQVYAVNPKTGAYIYAEVESSLFSAIRVKIRLANIQWYSYVGRSGRIIYYGSNKGVMAGVGFPESAWVFVVSKLGLLREKLGIPYEIWVLIS